MTYRLPGTSALDYFASLVAEDEGFALLEAAIAVAQDEYPGLDPLAVLADVDRRNSYLNDVLASRRGIPITLALLYIELASQAGLTARGVSFPGHFLVKLRMPKGEVVIDAFSGRSLSREDLDERLAPYRQRHGLTGDFETPLGLFLQATPARDVLARLLRNLKEIHRSAEDWPRALAVQQRLVVLLPRSGEERRDRGLVWAELGRPGDAVTDLQAYVDAHPDADDAAAIQERLRELRRQDAPRLH